MEKPILTIASWLDLLVYFQKLKGGGKVCGRLDPAIPSLMMSYLVGYARLQCSLLEGRGICYIWNALYVCSALLH